MWLTCVSTLICIHGNAKGELVSRLSSESCLFKPCIHPCFISWTLRVYFWLKCTVHLLQLSCIVIRHFSHTVTRDSEPWTTVSRLWKVKQETHTLLCRQNKMTSPESTSDSSWNTAGIPNTLATDDTAVDPGSTLPRHQTSLLGIDIASGQMTDNTLARPVMCNEVSHAATRG